MTDAMDGVRAGHREMLDLGDERSGGGPDEIDSAAGLDDAAAVDEQGDGSVIAAVSEGRVPASLAEGVVAVWAHESLGEGTAPVLVVAGGDDQVLDADPGGGAGRLGLEEDGETPGREVDHAAEMDSLGRDRVAAGAAYDDIVAFLGAEGQVAGAAMEKIGDLVVVGRVVPLRSRSRSPPRAPPSRRLRMVMTTSRRRRGARFDPLAFGVRAGPPLGLQFVTPQARESMFWFSFSIPLRGPSDQLALLLGNDEFEFDIVGESHYQVALDGLTGGKTRESARFERRARLVMETTNPRDRHAVAVMIKSKKVGRLSADHDIVYRKAIRRLPRRGGVPGHDRRRLGWRLGRHGSFGEISSDRRWASRWILSSCRRRLQRRPRVGSQIPKPLDGHPGHTDKRKAGPDIERGCPNPVQILNFQ